MKKLGLLTAAVAMLAVAGGAALGQGHGGGHGGGGHGGGGGGAWSGGAPGGGHGGAHPGGSYGGGARAGGGHGHAYGGSPGTWHGGGWSGGGSYHGGGYRGWYGGGYRGWYGGGYRGWYGPSFGVYFGAPLWWGAYPYPYPYYYPYSSYYPYPAYYGYPGYYPYPAYVDPGPTVYIQKPPVVAAAPPPPPPAPRAAAPQLERYTLSAKELFAFDSVALRMPQPKLDEIADAMVRKPQITGVMIVGYTDRLGSDAYNLKLSQRRADAVKAYLIGKGVAANRLTATGRGKANPVVQCEGQSGAALIACLEPNRRVEVEQITIERPMG